MRRSAPSASPALRRRPVRAKAVLVDDVAQTVWSGVEVVQVAEPPFVVNAQTAELAGHEAAVGVGVELIDGVGSVGQGEVAVEKVDEPGAERTGRHRVIPRLLGVAAEAFRGVFPRDALTVEHELRAVVEALHALAEPTLGEALFGDAQQRSWRRAAWCLLGAAAFLPVFAFVFYWGLSGDSRASAEYFLYACWFTPVFPPLCVVIARQLQVDRSYERDWAELDIGE